MSKPIFHTFVFLVCLAILPIFLHSQTRIGELPDLQWYKTVAGFNENDTYKDLEQDSVGSIFYAGSYNSGLYIGVLGNADTTVFDSVAHNPQTGNAYVVKLDTTGEYQWSWIIRGDPQSLSLVSDLVSDGVGGVWITGYYRGNINLPFVGDFQDSLGHGFLLHLDSRGQPLDFLRMTGLPAKLFIDSDGNRHLLLNVRGASTVAVGNDTLSDFSSNDSFFAFVKINAAGQVLKTCFFDEIGPTQAFYNETAAIDVSGSIFIIFRAFGSPITELGEIGVGNDTIAFRAHALLKIDSNYRLIWVDTLGYLGSGLNMDLKVSNSGLIYLAADTRAGPEYSRSFVRAYNTSGRQLWEISASGYGLETGGIATAGDYLYWTGSYQCDMRIDTINFFTGNRQPFASIARTGFIALINRHTGKLAWARSDETSDQIKLFGKLVVQHDTNLTIATRVTSPKFDADTLSLLIGNNGLPYNILLNFKEQPLPKLPELPKENFDVQLWPNPSSGFVNIRLDDSWGSNTKLEIYNLHGQLLRVDEISSQQSQIDVRRLSSQILVVVLRNDESGKLWTKKLVLLR